MWLWLEDGVGLGALRWMRFMLLDGIFLGGEAPAGFFRLMGALLGTAWGGGMSRRAWSRDFTFLPFKGAVVGFMWGLLGGGGGSTYSGRGLFCCGAVVPSR